MEDPKVYFTTNDREVHMFGDNVGVCWNIEYKLRHIREEDGLTYEAMAPIRKGDPYIDFVNIEYHNNKVYEMEDSPVEGGLSLKFTEQIYQELEQAIVYLRSL